MERQFMYQMTVWKTVLFCLVHLHTIQNLQKHPLNWRTNIFRNALISEEVVLQPLTYVQ